MASTIEVIDRICKDQDRPGCLGTPDERYTMRFDDIGEQPIYWCAKCGPEAEAMSRLLMDAVAKDPVKRARLEELIAQEEVKAQEKKS